MSSSAGRTILAGLTGGIAANVAMILTFRVLGFGWRGGGILVNPVIQSPKLIAVWTQLAPLPLVVTKPAVIAVGLILFGIVHTFIYRWLSPGWPVGITARAVRLAGLVFVLSFLFFEFFTPFNMFGEPLRLVALQLVFWLVVAGAEGFAIAAVFEQPPG